jgi:hypothetical protein
MSKIEKIMEKHPDYLFMVMDGFDDAILGMLYTSEDSKRLIYSVKRIIEILCEDMPEEDAWEFFEYNIAGSFMGDQTPLLCYDLI